MLVEGWVGAVLGRAVGGLGAPGADLGADVAAESPIVELGAECAGDGAALLDGPVADAAPGVEHAGFDQGGGGAGIDAGAAGAAGAGGGGRELLRGEGQVDDQGA